MPKLHIKKTVEIVASEEKIYKILSDFNTWKIWSPWLVQDPLAKFVVAADGESYAWEGKRVGSGNMKKVGQDFPHFMEAYLTFIKPWKSTAKVRFDLKRINAQVTEVTWSMDSYLPLFMFWMKSTMETFVGLDYKRGLAMLKDLAEHGEVHSELDFKGIEKIDEAQYVGVKTTCLMDEVGDFMKQDFEKLNAYMRNHIDLVKGKGFTIYHKWDFKKKSVTYTSGIPVSSAPNNLPDGMFVSELPESKVYTLRHTGYYEHLGNAWSTIQSMSRAKEIKPNKNLDMFEVYHNVPGDVPNENLITEVHFPIKE